MTLTNPASGRPRRVHSSATASGAWLRTPRATRIAPQTARPAATMPGNHAGPNFWPCISGNPWICQRMTRPRTASAAPVTASLIFTLFGDAHGFHHRAQVLVRLRHELPRVVGTVPDHAEAARGHEVSILLRVVDLLQ